MVFLSGRELLSRVCNLEDESSLKFFQGILPEEVLGWHDFFVVQMTPPHIWCVKSKGIPSQNGRNIQVKDL